MANDGLDTLASFVSKRDEVTFKFITLDQYHLDFFHGDLPPINNPERELASNEQQWIDDMQAADGYIFITPEYNHSIPAVLKNAIDYLAFEGNRKPAKIISYANSMRAGQFGGEALREVINRLGFITQRSPRSVKLQQTFQRMAFCLKMRHLERITRRNCWKPCMRSAFTVEL